ncbi:hypothetical protein C8F04DRAFT_1259028 [Mycena alexandri]|uniref:Ribonuclease H1 N-terminal domain-containing protein n=1 Tax=Mycena alexandri TaxID=1745969 RepID=A0AAD6X7Z8_9AGAR|nr:hypothetical protein C8F04DRAFT_1259028 [Mycena alexandri]
MPRSPPAYDIEDTDNNELALLLATLSINALTPRAPTPPPLRPPPPVTPPRPLVSPPATPLRPSQLYSYRTPQVSGVTSSWAVAADLTQGVPAATPRRLTPKPKKKSSKKKGYAVFCGLNTGAFRSWELEVEPLVKGVSNSIHQGYATFELAQAAYAYALQRGWTRIIGDPRDLATSAGPLIRALPTPVGLLERPNALHAGNSGPGLWYNVYCGISPGVYQSSLECSLNTLGLKCAVFESCGSKEEAIERFQRALSDGRVHSLYPVYTL